MSGLDLFEYAERRPNYRPTDPKTSRDAGRGATSDFTAEHERAILYVLRRAGRAMAPEEISEAMSFLCARGFVSVALDKVQVCKRISSLLESGEVIRTAERHTNRSGRSAFRLRIKR